MPEEDKKALQYFYNLRATIDESNMLFDEDINVKCGKETVKQITTILNLIQSQQEEIELNNKVIDKRNEENLKLVEKCLKKDKIIDLMARFIEERLNECPYDFWIETEKELNCENCEEDYAKCWKQYFEKKVEGK